MTEELTIIDTANLTQSVNVLHEPLNDSDEGESCLYTSTGSLHADKYPTSRRRAKRKTRKKNNKVSNTSSSAVEHELTNAVISIPDLAAGLPGGHQDVVPNQGMDHAETGCTVIQDSQATSGCESQPMNIERQLSEFLSQVTPLSLRQILSGTNLAAVSNDLLQNADNHGTGLKFSMENRGPMSQNEPSLSGCRTVMISPSPITQLQEHLEATDTPGQFQISASFMQNWLQGFGPNLLGSARHLTSTDTSLPSIQQFTSQPVQALIQHMFPLQNMPHSLNTVNGHETFNSSLTSSQLMPVTVSSGSCPSVAQPTFNQSPIASLQSMLNQNTQILPAVSLHPSIPVKHFSSSIPVITNATALGLATTKPPATLTPISHVAVQPALSTKVNGALPPGSDQGSSHQVTRLLLKPAAPGEPVQLIALDGGIEPNKLREIIERNSVCPIVAQCSGASITTTTHTYSAMESLLQASHMYTSTLKQQQSATGPNTYIHQQQQQQMQHVHYQQMIQQQQHQAQQQLQMDQHQHQEHVNETHQEDSSLNLQEQNESQMFYQPKTNMDGMQSGSPVSEGLYLHHHHHHQQQQKHHQQSCENSQELQVLKEQQHEHECQPVGGNNINIHQHLHQEQQQQQSIFPNCQQEADASTSNSISVWCQQQQQHGRDTSGVSGTQSKGFKQSGPVTMASTGSSNHLVTSLHSSQPLMSVSNHTDDNNTEQASVDPSNTEQRNTEQAEVTGHSPSYPQSTDVEPLPLPTFFDNQNCVFCVDCNKVFASGCRVHRTDYVYQSDTPVLSRARASLPQCFMLQKTGTTQVVDLLGVWCKGCLSERTIFGPMVGEKVELTNKNFADQELGFHPFLIRQSESSKLVLHLVDEAVCNWTMFIQFAPTLLEQNCTVYRDNGNFFIVTKTEIKDEELLLWFSAELCLELGITQNPGNHPFYQCPECSLNFLVKRFLNAHQKTKHPEKYSYTTDCYMSQISVTQLTVTCVRRSSRTVRTSASTWQPTCMRSLTAVSTAANSLLMPATYDSIFIYTQVRRSLHVTRAVSGFVRRRILTAIKLSIRTNASTSVRTVTPRLAASQTSKCTRTDTRRRCSIGATDAIRSSSSCRTIRST
ncbi:uncharacterized protein LOC127850658 isoform X2 [Dreissena polymorpha]|uniref:uncharacterized protein LOC127850658 isoform X2 n=1 Tax=Dreissena polymorpha TaxID=45954 RepID=UPI0022654178|nr:uncharacterized protein LOC127850658 isoform X2 [Dreissena polymorpha]